MLLTVTELAVLLRWNVQTVYRKVKKGEIPAVKMGGSIRFKSEDIDRWILNEAIPSSRKGAINGR